MILNELEIKNIILNQPNKALVAKGVQYNKKLRKHLYGNGLESDIKVIEGYERKQLHELRKTYSRSNKDLFARLGRPIDKVFSAKGGKVYYSLPEAQEKRAMLLASEIHNGLSIREWIQKFWKPHMLDDPFGMVFMEILTQQQVAEARKRGRSFIYPTYRSITDVYDYLPKGNKLEYVVFNFSDSEKLKHGIVTDKMVYRVVDDSYDYLVMREGDDAVILMEHTLPNFFGEVPAIINSDIINPDVENCYLSFFDEVVELADHYWMKGSIKVTHDFLHGFPKYAEFADDCGSCEGTGYKGGEQCPDCRGTKKKLMFKVSDAKALSWPQKEDGVILPTQVAGYISPDKTFHEIATADIRALEDIMNVTLWGVQSKVRTGGISGADGGDAKTATEVMDDTRPIADRLAEITKMAEKRHKFILDAMVRIQISQNYSGSSVNYGRRYMLESVDAIWKKYSTARASGAPQNVLDDLLNEYNETNYQSDPIGLEIATKLMYVEPFVHMSASQLKGLNPDPRDFTAKLYFSEWVASITESLILMSTVEELRKLLYSFCEDKQFALERKPEPAL